MTGNCAVVVLKVHTSTFVFNLQAVSSHGRHLEEQYELCFRKINLKTEHMMKWESGVWQKTEKRPSQKVVEIVPGEKAWGILKKFCVAHENAKKGVGYARHGTY